MGLSTLTAIYLLWLALFNPAKEIMIVSIGSRESKEFLKHIKIAYDRLPSWLAGKLAQENKSTLVFDNGSRIQSIPSPKYAARSFSASFLVIDEAAFIANIESLWTSAFPILSTGGKAIVLSTVNGTYGIGQWFYYKWKEAEMKINNFNAIPLMHTEHPDYNSREWEDAQKKDLGERKYNQEVLMDFSGSTDTFIPHDIINKFMANIQPPIIKRYDEKLWIWKKPMVGHFYVMGVDCAKLGKGRSNSAFHILDIMANEQVAEYCGKMNPKEYAELAVMICREYNSAFMILEINNMGLAVIQEIYYHLNYPNIYYRKGGLPGWDTTVKTRPLIIEAIERLFTRDLFKINGIRTINELQTFARDELTGTVEKQKGSTDDLLISLGIAVIGIKKAINANPAMGAMLLPDSTIDPMTELETTFDAVRQIFKFRKDPWIQEIKMRDGKVEKEDLRWLIE
jgi:hypothetical protein